MQIQYVAEWMRTTNFTLFVCGKLLTTPSGKINQASVYRIFHSATMDDIVT